MRTRLNETLVALARWERTHAVYAPTATELETFAQVRSRTYGKRLSDAVKAGLVNHTFGGYRCRLTGRKARRFWLTLKGLRAVEAMGEKTILRP